MAADPIGGSADLTIAGVIERKSSPLVSVETKATQPGYFKALVSAFGNVDEGDDRVVKGAFADDIVARNGVYPLVWSHDWNTVPIGKSISATETDDGLVLEGELLVNDHPLARQVYAAFKAGVPLEFSFSYDITNARYVSEGGKEIRELLGLKMLEAGPTLIGMNRETRLEAVKSYAAKPEAVPLVSDVLHAQLVASQEETLRLLKSQDAKGLLKSITGGDEGEPPAGGSEPAPAPDPNPTSPAAAPEPDPADAGSSETTGDPDQEGEPSLTPAQVAEAVRYLATPV